MDTSSKQNTLTHDYLWDTKSEVLSYLEHDSHGHHLYIEIAGWDKQFANFESMASLSDKPIYEELFVYEARISSLNPCKSIPLNKLYNSKLSIVLSKHNQHVSSLVNTCPVSIRTSFNNYPGWKFLLMIVLSRSSPLQKHYHGGHALTSLLVISAYIKGWSINMLENSIEADVGKTLLSFGFHPDSMPLLKRLEKMAYPGYLSTGFISFLSSSEHCRAILSLSDSNLKHFMQRASLFCNFKGLPCIDELIRSGNAVYQEMSFFRNVVGRCKDYDSDDLYLQASNNAQEFLSRARDIKAKIKWRRLREKLKDYMGAKQAVFELFPESFKDKHTYKDIEYPAPPFEGTDKIIPLTSEIELFRVSRFVSANWFSSSDFWDIYRGESYEYLYLGVEPYVFQVMKNNVFDAEISICQNNNGRYTAPPIDVHKWLDNERAKYIRTPIGFLSFLVSKIGFICRYPISKVYDVIFYYSHERDRRRQKARVI
jgi:hypothetical protein